jgi:hypothetical protein
MQVPPPHWNTNGTKQGIYCIGPDAEYLGARFASPPAADVRAMLAEALRRWDAIKAEKGYTPEPLPKVPTRFCDPNAPGLMLQVNSRDLPRSDGTTVGKRYKDVPDGGRAWPDFTKWAWNQNWLSFTQEQAEAIVPARGGKQTLPATIVSKLARESLIDNVRGQCPPWREEHIRRATLASEWTGESGGLVTMRLSGDASLGDGSRSYDCTLYGTAIWDSGKRRFTRFELVAIGTRRGAWIFNQRERDPGPALMGVSFVIEGQ